MASADLAAELANALGNRFFDGLLGGPAELIRSRAKVAAGDEKSRVPAYPPCYPDKEKALCLEPVAQLVEHRTFNAMVAGSSPARLTNHSKELQFSVPICLAPLSCPVAVSSFAFRWSPSFSAFCFIRRSLTM